MLFLKKEKIKMKKSSLDHVLLDTICFSSDCENFRSCLVAKEHRQELSKNKIISWVNFHAIYKGKCELARRGQVLGRTEPDQRLLEKRHRTPGAEAPTSVGGGSAAKS